MRLFQTTTPVMFTSKDVICISTRFESFFFSKHIIDVFGLHTMTKRGYRIFHSDAIVMAALALKITLEKLRTRYIWFRVKTNS